MSQGITWHDKELQSECKNSIIEWNATSSSLLIMLDTAGVIPDIPHTAKLYKMCIFEGFFLANMLCYAQNEWKICSL